MLHHIHQIIAGLKAKHFERVATDPFERDWDIARSQATSARELAEIDAIFSRHSGT